MKKFKRCSRILFYIPMNKAVLLVMMVLVVGSLFALAQEQLPPPGQQEQEVSQGLEEQECGFWCQLGKFLSGEGREKVAGEATGKTPDLTIPESLKSEFRLVDGVKITSTSGAVFEVKNGGWVKIKGTNKNPANLDITADLQFLNYRYWWIDTKSKPKKFTVELGASVAEKEEAPKTIPGAEAPPAPAAEPAAAVAAPAAPAPGQGTPAVGAPPAAAHPGISQPQADAIATKFGFTGGLPATGGVYTYSSGQKTLTINADGSKVLNWNVPGKPNPIIVVMDSKGNPISMSGTEILGTLSGEYSDNKALVDALYHAGVFGTGKAGDKVYKEIKGGYPWNWEEDMSFVAKKVNEKMSELAAQVTASAPRVAVPPAAAPPKPPEKDWKWDKKFEGLPGGGELRIKNGKLELDCGWGCEDKPLIVDQNDGEIKGWDGKKFVVISPAVLNAIPNVRAKVDLIKEQDTVLNRIIAVALPVTKPEPSATAPAAPPPPAGAPTATPEPAPPVAVPIIPPAVFTPPSELTITVGTTAEKFTKSELTHTEGYRYPRFSISYVSPDSKTIIYLDKDGKSIGFSKDGGKEIKAGSGQTIGPAVQQAYRDQKTSFEEKAATAVAGITETSSLLDELVVTESAASEPAPPIEAVPAVSQTPPEAAQIAPAAQPVPAATPPPAVPSPPPTLSPPPAPPVPTLDLSVTGNVKSLLPDGTIITEGQNKYKVEKGKWKKVSGAELDTAQVTKLNTLASYQKPATGSQTFTIQLSKDSVESLLGQEIGGKYYEQIDWGKVNFAEGFNWQNAPLELKGGLGNIKRSSIGDGTLFNIVMNVNKGTDQDKSNSKTVLMKQGPGGPETIASQSKQQEENGQLSIFKIDEGKPTLESVYVGKEEQSGVEDLLKEGKNIDLPYYEDEKSKKEKKEKGRIEHDKASGETTNTNYDEERQTIVNSKTGEQQQLEGDYYSGKDAKSCDDAFKVGDNCFIPSGGTLTTKDGRTYLADYDTEGTGVDQKLQGVELFNPVSGKLEGFKTPEGSIVLAKKTIKDGQEEYTGEIVIQRQDGTVISAKKEGDSWKCTTQTTTTVCNEDQVKIFKTIESGTTGTAAKAQTTLQSIYAVTNAIKSYPAISNFLFGKSDWYQDWQRKADQAFAPLLGTTWFPSQFCGEGKLFHYDIEPKGTAVIQTAADTYQTVASVQMERSDPNKKSPLLCQRNLDQEAEQEFICAKKQVCVDDTFCYKDQDEDGEPDPNADEPLTGIFYKITWGVSAPRDEAFTPLRDENGVAVSFNVYIDTVADDQVSSGAIPLYNLDGNTVSPIQLKNGGSDHSVFIKYSDKTYAEACIQWYQAPLTMDVSAGGVAATIFTGGVGAYFTKPGESIGDVCFAAETSTLGQVNYEQSGREVPSTTVSGGQVSSNTDW